MGCTWRCRCTTSQTVRHQTIFAGILVILGSVVHPASTKPVTASYSIDDVGTLGGSEAFAYAINDRGDVVGLSRTRGDAAEHSFMYRSGPLTDLAPLNSGSFLTYGPSGLNNRGQVASGIVHNGTYVPALYDSRSGRISLLGTLGSSASEVFNGVATAVNDFGHATGYSMVDAVVRHAFLWRDGRMTDIGSLGGYSVAMGINNRDVIVGFSSDTPFGYSHAITYHDGVMEVINPFGNPTNESVATAVNDRGEIVGYGSTPDGSAFHAFLSVAHTITDLGTLPGGFNSIAYGINDHGDIVGIADAPFTTTCTDYQTGQQVPCVEYHQHAFVYQRGVMLDLNQLIPAGSGWELEWASGVNTHGQIVGYGTRNGRFRSFVMTPVHRDETRRNSR